jgi:hypothetical protein
MIQFELISSERTMRALNRLKNTFFILSALWALTAGFIILLRPLTVNEQVAQQVAGSSGSTETVTRQVSWFAVQGVWGIVVLLLFTLIFAVGAFASIRDRSLLLAAASLTALALTYLSGFSIGMYYLPSAAAVVLGWVIVTIGLLRDTARKKI